MLFAVVAGVAPAVKFVEAPGLPAIVGQRVRAAKGGAVAGVHVVFASAAGGVSFSFAHGDGGGIPVGIDIHAVFAGALQG